MFGGTSPAVSLNGRNGPRPVLTMPVGARGQVRPELVGAAGAHDRLVVAVDPGDLVEQDPVRDDRDLARDEADGSHSAGEPPQWSPWLCE